VGQLEAPGEVRDIGIMVEGDGRVVLDWKPPVDGGAVAAYTIQRRRRDGGSWQDVGASVDTEELVSGQERGVEFDYRVVAVNRAGTGKPSAAVTAVL
jgi:titin